MRRVKPVALSQRNLNQFIDRLNATEPQDWPTFLYRAWAIVAIELEKPDVARETVISTVAAAHACALAVSARVQANARSLARQEVSSAISSIFNCIKRSSASIRNALNEVAQIEFREGHADSEVVTNFFNGCADFVKGVPSEADVVRMVNAFGVPNHEIEKLNRRIPAKPTLKLISDWESMHPSVRTSVELELQRLVSNRSSNLKALEVFSTLAHSLANESVTETRENSGDLLIAYVAEVAEIWRRWELYPGRATRGDDSEYRSQFHRFLELVLINQFDPRSRLFDRLDEKELMRNRKFIASLALDGDERGEAGIGPRYQWLIGEYHIREANKPDSKNET